MKRVASTFCRGVRIGATSTRFCHQPSSTNDITARIESLERQLNFWQSFKREVEMRNPSMASECAAAALTSPPTKQIPYMDPSDLEELYEFYALQPRQEITLKEIVKVKNVDELVYYAKYVHREYMVRLAQRARSLRYAPLGLAQMPSLRELRRWYEASFVDMKRCGDISTREGLVHFDGVVRRVLGRHINTTDLLSNGIYEFASREQILTEKKLQDTRLISMYAEVQEFFDEFCDTRVRLRFLLGHHIYLSASILTEIGPSAGKSDGTVQDFYDHSPAVFSGQVCHACDVRKVVHLAIKDAMATEVDDPDLIPSISLHVSEEGKEVYEYSPTSGEESKPFTFFCCPSLVFFSVASIVGEAVRTNMMRKLRYMSTISPVKVVITQGPSLSDVIITVTDTAGGMPLPVVNTSLTYISACRTYVEDEALASNSSSIKVGAGWNHTPIRMPYAAVAARLFLGDITVTSLEGVGTERCLYLSTDRHKIERVCI